MSPPTWPFTQDAYNMQQMIAKGKAMGKGSAEIAQMVAHTMNQREQLSQMTPAQVNTQVMQQQQRMIAQQQEDMQRMQAQ
eukprot:2874220-Pyramimonas_sp.AAC.1